MTFKTFTVTSDPVFSLKNENDHERKNKQYCENIFSEKKTNVKFYLRS